MESLHSGVSLELDFGVSPELLDVVELLDVTELLDTGVSFELELDCTALDLGVSLELLDLGTSLELEFTALDWGLSLELEGGTTELEEAGSLDRLSDPCLADSVYDSPCWFRTVYLFQLLSLSEKVYAVYWLLSLKAASTLHFQTYHEVKCR